MLGRGERATLALQGGVTSSSSLAGRKSVRPPRKPSRYVRPCLLPGARCGLNDAALVAGSRGVGLVHRFRPHPGALGLQAWGSRRAHSWWVHVTSRLSVSL